MFGVLVLGQGLPGLRSSWAPLRSVHGSLAALHAALLVHINPGQPWQSVHLLHQQQLSTLVTDHLELRLEVARDGVIFPIISELPRGAVVGCQMVAQ